MDLDLLIIGGGVNGAGIARDAAQRGLKVALVEQNDLGAGTSGASSGMIHGGIRYLETDRHTTHKSCLDSGYIQSIAPHLLFRIPLIFPLLKWMPNAKALYELAFVYFRAYDRFQPLKRGKRACKLSAEECFKLEPGLSQDTIGGVSTDEWGINVFRLCLLNALDAHERGAQILLKQRVVSLLRDPSGRVLGARLRDLNTGECRDLKARLTFNATGPWAGRVAKLAGAEVKLRPGKGIHLVLDRRILNYALLATAVDGRQVFIEPYGQETWIGTTDDDYYGDPAEVRATHDEVEYLLQAVERVFPNIRRYRLLRAFAGVRPTLFSYGGMESSLSRDHQIFDHSQEGAPGLLSMGGGKLAAYRMMSEEATDRIAEILGEGSSCHTHDTPLPGGEERPKPKALAEAARISEYAAARMIHRHGARCERILERIKRHPEQRRLVCRCEPVTEAEIHHVIEEEWVSSLEDLRRRTHCSGGACQGTRCARRAARILNEHQEGGPKELETLLREFLSARWREQAPVLGHNDLPQLELQRWALRPEEI